MDPLPPPHRPNRNQYLRNIRCDLAEVTEASPHSSQKPWGFASKAERFGHYLSEMSRSLSAHQSQGQGQGHSHGQGQTEGYMAHLKASRAFFSPHSSEAMAEALGAERAYEGLSGSLLMPGMNNPQELRQHLKQLIDRSWSDEALRHGVSYATAGQHSEAIKSYNRALELCPANHDARVARGAALANQQSYDDAVADFEAVLQQEPKNSNAASYLAAVRIAAESRKKAGAQASKAQSKVASVAADAFLQTLQPQDSAGTSGDPELALAIAVGKSRKKGKKDKHKKHKKEKRARSND